MEHFAFDEWHGKWHVTAFYLDRQHALITIAKVDEIVRQFIYPSYRIYNIAAHFSDIVWDIEHESEPQ